MKVLFVHHGVVLGGAPVSLVGLVREFEKSSLVTPRIASHSVAMRRFFDAVTETPVIEWPDPQTLVGKVLVGYTALDSRLVLRALARSLWYYRTSIQEQTEFLRRERPDIVHLNSIVLLTTALAARQLGLPIVWHVRETIQGRAVNPRRRLYAVVVKRLADRVICISPAEAGRLGENPAGMVGVVFNPIDFERLAPERYDRAAVREAFGYDRESQVILSLGGVAARKGAAELLDAMNRLSKGSRLILAGPSLGVDVDDRVGRGWRRVEDALVHLGIKEYLSWYYPERAASLMNASSSPAHVRFTGDVDDVGPLLAAADVLVFGGTMPHFPRPIFEAWAMKKPVVVFDVDGIRQNVQDGVDGVVVKETSGRALAEAIRRLLEEPDRMRAMGERGYVKARAMMDPQKGAERVLDIYRQVLGK